MPLTGVEAQLMVPRALTVMEGSESARQAWAESWGSASLHVLLPWAAQMLSLLGSPQGAALLPSLKVQATSCTHLGKLLSPFMRGSALLYGLQNCAPEGQWGSTADVSNCSSTKS